MKKLILLSFFFLSSCKLVDTKELLVEMHYHETKVSIVAVGDNLIHHTIYESSKQDGIYDFKALYHYMKPYIKQFDLAFINQETILGGSEIGLSSYPLFNSPYEVGDALIDTGFNLISTANNHTLDKGEIAIKNSINYWSKQPVIYSGSELSNVSHVKQFTVNDIKFAFVAYTYGTNGLVVPPGKAYLVNTFSYEKANRDLKNLKAEVDVIIVSMHWGHEYQNQPSNYQKEQANYLAHLGVDLILGHHPHVIQPFDIIKTKESETYVIYSLGNFMSDQRGIDRLIGMAFSIEITKSIKDEDIKVRIDYPHAKLFYTSHNLGQFQNIFLEDLDQTILNQHRMVFDQKKVLIQSLNSNISIS